MSCSVGVYLALNGILHPNNSNISIDMIGEESDEALLCLTDLYQFVIDREAIGNVGQWYFPNQSTVSHNMNNDIYMTLSRGLGVVRLHRKNNTLLPIGKFRCDILDSDKIRQCIYITVYDDSVSTTSSSLASFPGSDPDSSSPTSCCITSEAEVSVAVIGGAGVGGLLLVLIIVVVGIILVIHSIKR